MHMRRGMVMVKPYAGISLLFSKSTNCTSFNSTCAFTPYALRRDLGITQVYFEWKLAIEVLLHHPSYSQREIFY